MMILLIKNRPKLFISDFIKRVVLDYLTSAEKQQRARDAAVEAVARFFRK